MKPIDSIEIATPPYPALLWFGRHGMIVAVAAMLVAIGGGAELAYTRAQPLWLVTGVAVAVAGGFLLRLLIEVVRLLVETLIPQ